MKLDKIKRIKLISSIFRAVSPGYSYCTKCGLPWNHCQEKSVYYTSHNATFATCQHCWDNSTLPELKKYYTHVYNRQKITLFSVEHTLEHLLECVEDEYFKTRGIDKVKYYREQKLKEILE